MSIKYKKCYNACFLYNAPATIRQFLSMCSGVVVNRMIDDFFSSLYTVSELRNQVPVCSPFSKNALFLKTAFPERPKF